MAQYLAPGVYVEEVPSAVRPIAGVGTSTAAFIGVAANLKAWDPDKGVGMGARPSGGAYEQAAALTPQPLNSWTEFVQKFKAKRIGAHYPGRPGYAPCDPESGDLKV